MAYVALFFVVLFVVALLAALPSPGKYRCQECDYHTPDRQDAAGHQLIHSLHKMNL